MNSTKLSPAQIAEAKKLRSLRKPVSYEAIAKRFGVSPHAIQYATSSAYREMVANRNREIRSQIKGHSYNQFFQIEERIERNPLYDPRRDEDLRWESPGEYLLGSPPIGRRAIDKVAAA